MYSPEGHYRPYSSQKSRDRRQRRPPDPVGQTFKVQSDSQSCFREREDRVRPFLYKNPPAELRPLAVRAVTEEHTLLRETEALGHQEVRGMG